MNLDELIEEYCRLDAEAEKLDNAINGAFLRQHWAIHIKLKNRLHDLYHELAKISLDIEDHNKTL